MRWSKLRLRSDRSLHDTQFERRCATAANAESGEFSEVLAGELRIAVAKRGTMTTIALHGEWDLAAGPAVEQVVRDALADAPAQIVLDLNRLRFIDAFGLHGTVAIAEQCAAVSVRLRIVRGPRAVQRVFEVCGLTERLPFSDAPGSSRRHA
jgi:anti-anti-sigma factor